MATGYCSSSFRADEPQLGAVLGGQLPRLLEVELFYPQAALADLVGGDPELFEIAAGLAEMALEIENSLLETADVIEKTCDLNLDKSRLLAHAGVLEDRLERLNDEHKEIGRGDHDTGAVGLLDDILEALVKVGIDRL